MSRTRPLLTIVCCACLLGSAWADSPVQEIAADPTAIHLRGPEAGYSILVHGTTADGQAIDLTHTAHYRSSNPQLVAVNDSGIVRGLTDGTTEIVVEAAGKTVKVAVRVEGSAMPRRYTYETDILPLLSRYGCNASGCHGKAEGQNGFKLSVFGSDPHADFDALTKEGRGRRIFPAAPEQSLLLAKMSGVVAHGGGTRIPRGSPEYETFRGWVAAGTPFGEPTDPKVVSVRVEPHERQLSMKGQQQLRVVARWSDGRETDVTARARFQSNNDGLAMVDAAGLVTAGEAPGDVAVMAAFMNQTDVFRTLVPRAERPDPYPMVAETNFIDTLVFRKLRRLNVVPSEAAEDTEYLRRAYLDVIGTLPTSQETRKFLADQRPDRRARVVDDLLARPEYADYWAMRWADVLRVDRQALGHKRAYGYYRWVRDGFAADKPLDQFARELLTAEGPLGEVGPASFYKVATKPGEAASTLSQALLGVRIACAECHHHPFDRWSQDDYYGMTAFFTPLAVKATTHGDMLMAGAAAPAKNPRSGLNIPAHPLGVDGEPSAEGRATLAAWVTGKDNPFFARNLANRYWAHFLGRGLVEPVDDQRATNPPTNPELLDALAHHLVENKFDGKALIRTITASRVYQLSSRPNATNECDEQNYSRALLRPVEAEVLLDMVCQASGVEEKFPGVPEGTRAVQLWDSRVSHYFLKLFGRPVRATACECERSHGPSVAQVLHVLNSPTIHDKLTHEGGTVARLVRDKGEDGPLADELYLAFFSRLPTEKERQAAIAYLSKDKTKRREHAEDLAWALMNSLEFLFNH
jgi:hypothetical protein